MKKQQSEITLEVPSWMKAFLVQAAQHTERRKLVHFITEPAVKQAEIILNTTADEFKRKWEIKHL